MHKLEIELIWISRYDYEKGKQLAVHAHDYYQIIYLIDGDINFSYGGEPYPLNRGYCAVISPGVEHGFIHDNQSVVKTLDVKFRIHSTRLNQLMKQITGLHATVPKEMVVLLEQIKYEGTHQQPFFREMASLNLLKIVYMLHRKSTEAQTFRHSRLLGMEVSSGTEDGQAIVERTKEYIQHHYSGELRVADMAKRIGFHKNYMGQMFKQVCGQSISMYIKELRIGKAKELLAYSELTLKEIAPEVGFKNIHHFNRVFKQVEGISPGQWKRKEIQGIRKDIHF
ncbi:helix-turn-helix domain-containing protein [Paenibacillus soyae]|uniref:AraC family transcriptional regulator n=1 Tax=Paenibacillus soyae TaxID=2969249 RepID=A0A9X2MPZ9_9BACL|nr:AraC family transcriptional regulator [Paenibacillus soyae]MCR2804716.1 AraC family transcriptional regulator [Paenibacillus soyae]